MSVTGLDPRLMEFTLPDKRFSLEVEDKTGEDVR